VKGLRLPKRKLKVGYYMLCNRVEDQLHTQMLLVDHLAPSCAGIEELSGAGGIADETELYFSQLTHQGRNNSGWVL
jgi:hypothetical protein